MYRFAAAALVLLATTAATAPISGRLPQDAVPVSYDITIVPDAHTMTFTGRETIAVEVREAVTSLTLNAAELEISSAAFDTLAARPGDVRLDRAGQTVTVTLPRPAQPGRHLLSFTWRGKINNAAAGLFAIDYRNGDGTPARMLATQFEAPDARRFAPMWDEPGFKARFTLSAVAPAGQLAFSNMPAASVTRQADGTQLYRFGETPVMSSYLLFLGMGDLERRTVMAGRTEIGVISRKGVSAQGDYALSQAQRLLTYYNDYFGQPYPLPKLDMIAGPGSSQFFGAMENWGAIFYFEKELLVDPARTTEAGRWRIFTVVAHEMAHQWFGDLVTMAWWDDLWLNEGFASWMEAKSAGDLHPEWQARTNALVEAREEALALDATSATHPIIRHVETVDQISDAFDNITYLKGQAVIGMLEATIGPDRFRDGIRRYMAQYRYGNTVTDQLWAALSAAAGRPMATIAHDFTRQGGVPLLRVDQVRCTSGRTVATLRQARFGLDAPSMAAQGWHVPLLVTAGGPPQAVTVTGPQPQRVTVAGCGAFVADAGKGSYLRTLYDDAAHALLVRAYRRLSVDDRVGTLGDDFALAAGGYQDLSRWFALQAQVGTGANPFEWTMVAAGLEQLNDLYDGSPLAAPLRARTLARLSPVLAGLGYAPRAGESPLATVLRGKLIELLGGLGDPATVARARQVVAAIRRGEGVPAEEREAMLQTFAANATAAEWEQLLALAEAETSPVGRNRLIDLLGTARDPAVARRALDLVAGDRITVPQKASLLSTLAKTQPDMAFDWATAHLPAVNGMVEESSRARFVPSLGQASNDAAMPGKITAFAEANLPAGGRDPARRAVAQIAVRKATADRLRGAVARWVG